MNRNDLIISCIIAIVGGTLYNVQWALHTLYYFATSALFGLIGYGIVSLIKNLKK